jgi:hypothetical protein
MESWDDEFGYELVSNDMQLAFPPADPVLADLLGRTVADARRRQNETLLATLARPGNSGPRPYLRATSSGGGFVVEGEPGGTDASGFGGGGNDDSARQPYSTLARGNGGFAARGPSGAPGEANQQGTGRYPGGAPEDMARDSSTLRPQSGLPHAGQPAGPPPPGGGGFYGGPPRRPGTGEASSSPGGQLPQDSAGNMAANPTANPTANPAANVAANSAANASANPAAGAAARDRQATDNNQSFGGTSTGGVGNASQPEVCLADTRGRDWALPHAAQGSTGVTRPIRIVCAADQLTIVPQRGSGQTMKTVALQGSTLDAVDQFVSKLWQHIEEWQMAGPGLYWKPELIVEVAPGGRQRFEQLSQLLEGSGITVTQTTR